MLRTIINGIVSICKTLIKYSVYLLIACIAAIVFIGVFT